MPLVAERFAAFRGYFDGRPPSPDERPKASRRSAGESPPRLATRSHSRHGSLSPGPGTRRHASRRPHVQPRGRVPRPTSRREQAGTDNWRARSRHAPVSEPTTALNRHNRHRSSRLPWCSPKATLLAAFRRSFPCGLAGYAAACWSPARGRVQGVGQRRSTSFDAQSRDAQSANHEFSTCSRLKPRISRLSLNGSDGTRTRDLRRDRPAL